MSPFWQVIVGELIGILIVAIAIFICYRTEIIGTMLALIFGSIIVFALVALFITSEWNLYFSAYTLKNILIIAMYEEIIILVSTFLALMFSGIIVTDLDDKEVIVFAIIIIFLVSSLFGEQCFYKEIVKALE